VVQPKTLKRLLKRMNSAFIDHPMSRKNASLPLAGDPKHSFFGCIVKPAAQRFAREIT